MTDNEIASPRARVEALERLREAVAKIAPIAIGMGESYADVFFADGTTHSTQAMTMNPQDWLDIQAAFERASSAATTTAGRRTMVEATQEMIALAREIAERHADSAQECLFGSKVSQTVRRVIEDALAQAALAAIQATTERAAEYCNVYFHAPGKGIKGQDILNRGRNDFARQARDAFLRGDHHSGETNNG